MKTPKGPSLLRGWRIGVGLVAFFCCCALGAQGSGYLDRCNLQADCLSNLCVADLGATSFCSKACSLNSECADEHVCVDGQCVPDDTGASCAGASDCSTGLCLGASSSSPHCTRECTDSQACPAGFACMSVGEVKVCAEIEKPCSDGSDCVTGMCVDGLGCVSPCSTSLDCPGRYPGLPAYTCQAAFGFASTVCTPPPDVMGSDAIGAACSQPAENCRSAVCDDSLVPSACTQSCSAEGGCGPGFGCVGQFTASDPVLGCTPSGAGDLGTPCSTGLDCRSGHCDPNSQVCTRLCDDQLCPTDLLCSGQPAVCALPIFADGFESGDTTLWN